MNSSTITVIGTSITAVAAILAPVITTCINKHMENKKLKLEMFYKSKLEHYQNLLESFGGFCFDNNYGKKYVFATSLSKAISVSSNATRPIFIETLELLKSNDRDKVINYFNSHLDKIALDLDETRIKIFNNKNQKPKH